jgi:DNA-binding response OmpR family regulator
VLLDAIMPYLDGYEVTAQVRQNQKLSFMPIVLMTDCDSPSLVYRLDCGADDFICKPIKRKYLLAKIRALLRLKSAIDERDRPSRARLRDRIYEGADTITNDITIRFHQPL